MNGNINNPDEGHVSRGWPHSLWIDTTLDTNYPVLEQNIEVDTVILGGGIVGITTAILLKDAGQTVAVVEMHKIVKSVTGHTTAKVSALHGLKYHKLLRNFTEKKARVYAEANMTAIEKVASLVQQRSIDCDFKRTSAYTYTELDNNLGEIKRELEATQKLGLPTSFVVDTPLPFEIKGAVCLDNQAQFHPRKYLLALANSIPGDGSHVFENTRAFSTEEGEPCVVSTNQGDIRAKNVVLATAFPFHDTGHFYAKLYPYCFYLTGMHIKNDVPEGMYYSDDGGSHSIRNQPTDDGLLLIVGGGHHKTGQGGDTFKRYQEVEDYARERFDTKSVNYYWSTEDYSTPDMVPYIGKAPKTNHIYMATGFAGWGMTNSTVSAMLISDLILGRDNPWASFFDPSRHDIAQYGGTFMAEGINIVEQYGKEYLTSFEKMDPADLAEGEGKLIRADDKKIAAFKDDEGKIYTLSPSCVHMGCLVSWNAAERTWDCTCHGSRYNFNGEVIHGPATGDLPEEELGQ